jgi:DTW domain-containing protein YfiP
LDLQSYRLRRQQLSASQPQYRTLCQTCLQPQFGCYCEFVKKFDPKIKFVILIHPIEAKRRIATGRMSHLCLKNSELIIGQDYTYNEKVNDLLDDPQNQPLILYPGRTSVDISVQATEEKKSVLKEGKKPVLFVIDGTWATARKTMRQSENLKSIPRICFTPPKPSQFRVRKQPAPECYSTIEAIHHSIELLGQYAGFDVERREHDKLLFVFDKMVERQLEFIRKSFDDPKTTSYRKPRYRIA